MFVNAGFGELIGHQGVAAIRQMGLAGVRQGASPATDPNVLRLLLRELAAAGLKVVWLLGGGRLVAPDGSAWSPRDLSAHAETILDLAAAERLPRESLWLEVTNEPDLAHPDYANAPERAAEAAWAVADAVQGDVPVIAGSISNLNRRGLAYLAGMQRAGLPPQVVVGFHRYPHRDGPWVPHPGFHSRSDEWRAFREIVGARRVACTEVGHHTAERTWGLFGCHRVRLTDAQAAEHLLWDLGAFSAGRVELVAIYQLNDGPTNQAIDRYGLRTVDGLLKPQAEAIRWWVAQRAPTR